MQASIDGLPGLENFLDVIASPVHAKHLQALSWYGRPYDPEDMAELGAKRRIDVIVRHRVPADK